MASNKVEFDKLFDKESFDTGVSELVKVIANITLEINKAETAGAQLSVLFGTKLKKEISEISATSKTLASDLAKMTAKMDNYKAKTAGVEKVTKEYKAEAARLTAELDKLKASQEKTNKETDKGAAAAKGASTSYKGLAQSLLGVASGAALVYGGIRTLKEQIVLAVQSTIAFEKTMKEVQAVSGATGDELKLLSNNANKLGATTEKTAQQVAEAQKELAKLGFSTPEILMVTESIVDLSTATGEDLVKSAEVAAATLRAFGLDVSEMKRVTDVMTKSFVISALDLEKFRESIKLVAPIAAATNVGIEAVTASLAKLSDTGISGSLAGTAMRNLLSSMADPTEDLVKFMGQYDSTLKDGIKSSDDFTKALQVLKGANVDLETAVGMVDVRARTAFFTLVNYADDVEGLALELKYLDDETRKVANSMRDTLANDINVATSAFDSLRRNIVDGYIPAMREVVQDTTQYIEFLRFAIQAHKDHVKAVEEGTESMSFFDMYLEAVTTSFTGFIDGVGAASDAIMPFIKATNEANKIKEVFKDVNTSVEDMTDGFLKYNSALTANQQASLLLQASEKDRGAGVAQLREEYSELSSEVGKDADFLKLVKYRTSEVIKESQGHITVLGTTEEKLKDLIFSMKEEAKIKKLTSAQSLELSFAEAKLVQVQTLRIKYTDKLALSQKAYAKTAEELVTDLEAEESIKSKLLKLESQLSAIYAKTAEEQAKYALEEEDNLAKKMLRLEEYKEARIRTANQALNAEIKAIEASDDSDQEVALQKQIAYAKHKQELIKISQDYAKQEQGISKKILDFDAKLLDQEIKDVIEFNKDKKGMLDWFAKAKEDFWKKDQEGQDEQGDREYEDLVKFHDDKLKLEEEGKEKRLEIAEQIAQGLDEISTRLFDNQAMRRANEMTAIDSWEKERIGLAGDNEEAIAAIEKEAEERRNKVRTEQAKADKKEAIFKIAIQTAVNVVKYIGNPLQLAIAIGAGLAQAALVAARPLPKFEKGTDFSPEGHAIVGERGRELIKDGRSGNWRMSSEGASQTYLSRGSKVIPAHITAKILEGSHDHNGIAEQYLNKLSKKEEKELFDYNKLGEKFENAVIKIPVNQTNFDENGVTRFTIKRNSKVQRLNKRY